MDAVDVSVSAAADGAKEHQDAAVVDDATPDVSDTLMKAAFSEHLVVPDALREAAGFEPDAIMTYAAM